MASTGKSQSDIIHAWQNLIEQSVNANTAFLQESAKLFAALLSKKTETQDLLKTNTEFLHAAANNFIKLSITNTENLVSFGVNISRSFFSFADKKNNTDADSGGQTESSAGNAGNQINVSVKQGEHLSTSFYLNSHNTFSQTGKFYYEDLIDETTGNTAGISMLISPKEFTLEPGKSLQIDISIDVPNTINPGKYKSTVRLEGMDNQQFDMVVTVIEDTPLHMRVLDSTDTPKEAPAKKAATKNKK